METKMTVRVDRRLLENAKRYARENNMTLTELISHYLEKIPPGSGELEQAPIVRRLTGSLSRNIAVEDYKKHLEEKYGGK